MRLKSWLPILPLLIGNWTISWAQDGSDSINKVRLNAGQKAPFDGVLLTNGALAKLFIEFEETISLARLDIEKADKECKLRQEADKEICEAKLTAAEVKMKACEEMAKAQRAILSKVGSLKCPSPVWNYFTLGGVVVAAGICGASMVIK